jgi:hypothetical protein
MELQAEALTAVAGAQITNLVETGQLQAAHRAAVMVLQILVEAVVLAQLVMRMEIMERHLVAT